jgi:hypothetical protein
MERKKWADINGQDWQVCYPLCAGCPELCMGGSCAYEGNGCRFPDKRIERPISIYHALVKICQDNNWSLEEKVNKLGSCSDLFKPKESE